MTSRKGAFVLVIAGLISFVPATTVRAADTTAPGSPLSIEARPASATTRTEFRIEWENPPDESTIDAYHFTIGSAPTSNSDGQREETGGPSLDDTHDVDFIEVPVGETEIYFWLEDEEGNTDYHTAVLVSVYPEGEPEKFVRVAGETRYESAVKISTKVYPKDHSASAVVIASGESVVDAMVGASLATAAQAPVLYSKRYEIPSEVWAEVQRVAPVGATIYLLGGEQALDANQQAFFEANGYEVVRLSGRDRFETAVVVQEEVDTLYGFPSGSIFLVNGSALADGLSASPLFDDSDGVLLTERDAVPQRVLDYLHNNPETVFLLVGGTSVISDKVVAQLNAEGFYRFFRIGGRTRFDTSAAMVGFVSDTTQQGAGLVNGFSLADALPAGPHLAAQDFPLLLIAPEREENRCLATTRYLESKAAELEGGYVYGGSATVSTDAQIYFEELISGQASAGC